MQITVPSLSRYLTTANELCLTLVSLPEGILEEEIKLKIVARLPRNSNSYRYTTREGTSRLT